MGFPFNDMRAFRHSESNLLCPLQYPPHHAPAVIVAEHVLDPVQGHVAREQGWPARNHP